MIFLSAGNCLKDLCQNFGQAKSSLGFKQINSKPRMTSTFRTSFRAKDKAAACRLTICCSNEAQHKNLNSIEGDIMMDGRTYTCWWWKMMMSQHIQRTAAEFICVPWSYQLGKYKFNFLDLLVESIRKRQPILKIRSFKSMVCKTETKFLKIGIMSKNKQTNSK